MHSRAISVSFRGGLRFLLPRRIAKIPEFAFLTLEIGLLRLGEGLSEKYWGERRGDCLQILEAQSLEGLENSEASTEDRERRDVSCD